MGATSKAGRGVAAFKRSEGDALDPDMVWSMMALSVGWYCDCMREWAAVKYQRPNATYAKGVGARILAVHDHIAQFKDVT